MYLKLGETLLGLSVLASATDSVPTLGIENTCRVSVQAVADVIGSNTAVTLENCMKQEQAARQEIANNWIKYPVSDRQRCVDPKVYMPSYVEWLTCLEMYRDVREMKKNAPEGR